MSATAAASSSSSPPPPPSGFPTWTFDKPCTSIEWNDIVSTELLVLPSASSSSSFDEVCGGADLVLFGVMAPAPEADDGDEEEEEAAGSEEKEPDVVLTGFAKQADEQKLGGLLTSILSENAKTFKNGAKLASVTPTLRLAVSAPGGDGSKKSQRYVALGLGTAPKAQDEETGHRQAGKKDDDPFAAAGHALGKAVAEKCDSEKKVETAVVVLPSAIAGSDAIMTDFSAAFYRALYSDNRYRTGKQIKKAAEDLKTVTVLSEGSDAASAAAIETGKKLAKGILLTKDIVNSPHNVLNSLSLADTARRIAAESSNGTITCTVLGKEECEKRGMGSYLGVARGSETPPQFIHLVYRPPSGSVRRKVGIVGKGLLFDTGGYNIKVAMMEMMKFDCGGAAAVLGAARAIGETQPDGVEAHFIIAACENMINEKAYVPSDVLIASNGKTIEVMNTDAEGRLTLADALVFADKEAGCEKIIELSTLTGACIVALGTGMSGVWTANDDLASELEDVSKVTGDKSWRMPMEKSYNEHMESKVADIKNIGNTRFGGSIHAALFLQNFVSAKKPFAHIDIAGPTWDWTGSTASGYGARLVAEWIRRQGLSTEE